VWLRTRLVGPARTGRRICTCSESKLRAGSRDGQSGRASHLRWRLSKPK
jgi:hypothetical protein